MDSISESEECALSGGKERLLGRSIGLGREQLLDLPAGDPLGLESRFLRPGSLLPAPHASLLNASARGSSTVPATRCGLMAGV